MVQYSLDFQGNFGRVLKEYVDLKLGEIYSSCFIQNVAVFGGNKAKLAFIHSKKRQILENKFPLTTHYIYSIELAKLRPSEAKVFLTISGSNFSHFSSKTDFLDVTHFISNAIKPKLNKKVKAFKTQKPDQINKRFSNQFLLKSKKPSTQKLKKTKKAHS